MVTTPTRATTNPGGLLSGPSNQGVYERTRVSVVPEINLKLAYDVNPNIRLSLGYDALYMQHVVRTAQQTSFTNTVTQVEVAGTGGTTIGLQQPVVVLKDLDVWVQGINFGLELRY
jgi:long-subunit fatty acid transport protein